MRAASKTFRACNFFDSGGLMNRARARWCYNAPHAPNPAFPTEAGARAAAPPGASRAAADE
jgi:hypothetical protein